MAPAVGCLPRCEGAGTAVAPSLGHGRLAQDKLPHRDGATSTVHPLFRDCILPYTPRTETVQGLVDQETVARLRAWVVDRHLIQRSEEAADLAGTMVGLVSAG